MTVAEKPAAGASAGGVTPPADAPNHKPPKSARRPGAPSAASKTEPSADSLAIAGLVPLSTVDWPGKLAAVVFLQGCPLACPYCQNEAILDPKVPGAVPWSQVEALLARRAGLLDGVVLTGGEALRQAGVVDAARRVREMGFGVGLHTAGAYPRALAKTLPHTDWVGIDVKAMPDDYAAATGFGAGAKAWQSLDAVLEASAERACPALAAEAADADGMVERADCMFEPAGADYVAEPAGADRTVEPAGADRTVERADRTLEPAGADCLAQRAGADRTVERADVGPLDYEVRTTVYPGAPATERFGELLGELRARGVRNFALQEARTDGTPVDFRAQALAWDRRAWAKRLAEMVDAASRAGFESFEARLA